MDNSSVITADCIGKCYSIYSRPVDRLKQALWRWKRTYFDEFWALRDISFSIRKGETVGIIGANGSGKSTLLQIICGILAPSTGQLEIRGRIGALLELGAGFNPEFSGRDNIYTSAAIMGLTPDEITACYDDIVAFADIGAFIDQPVKKYSSGMYVRLAFATAIDISPDILIIDEALAVGDIRFQQKCMARIKRFCETGTVIFVSHDTNAVKELCDRAFWIKDGRLQMDDQPKYVVDKYLQFMYEGESAIEEEPAVSASPAAREAESPTEPVSVPDPPAAHEIRQFGDRRATIKEVRIVSQGAANSTVYSGKPCEITAIIEANDDIARPIVGFNVRDRLGREIFGDNTALMNRNPRPLNKKKRYRITFQINEWPNLCGGEYVVSMAVADGAMEDHIQCHWIHDAVSFTSIPVRIPGGLFSVIDSDVVMTPIR